MDFWILVGQTSISPFQTSFPVPFFDPADLPLSPNRRGLDPAPADRHELHGEARRAHRCDGVAWVRTGRRTAEERYDRTGSLRHGPDRTCLDPRSRSEKCRNLGGDAIGGEKRVTGARSKEIGNTRRWVFTKVRDV